MMPTRPQRLWDQYLGKAMAEAMRGCGRWPLQPRPCDINPPYDGFDPEQVNLWDCIYNDWEAAWSPPGVRGLLTREKPIRDRKVPIVLPLCDGDIESLVPIVIAQFAEDRSTIDKADQLLRSLPLLRAPAAFELHGNGARSVCQFVVHREDAGRFERLLVSHYPESAVVVSDKAIDDIAVTAAERMQSHEGYAAMFCLDSAYCFTLRTFTGLDPDPLAVAITAMDDLRADEWATLQILFERTESPWWHPLQKALQNPHEESFLLEDVTPADLQQKFSGPIYAVAIRIAASRQEVFRQLIGWAEQFTTGYQRLVLNMDEWEGLSVSTEEFRRLALSILHRVTFRPGMLLNVSELSSLIHLPGQSVVSSRLQAVRHRTRPAAETAEEEFAIALGDNIHRGKKRTARISPALRERHAYVAGASGTGKSTLLLNMVLQDIDAGHGVGVLDPHGDLIHDILARIPDHRIDDTILFDPSDSDYPIALNILEVNDKREHERIVAEILMALERYFPSSWGPRLERILTFTLYTLLDALESPTLLHVERMLINPRFRDDVVDRCSNRRYVEFWRHEMTKLPGNAVDPVLNKLSVFLLNETVRNIICQPKSAIDFDHVLNSRKIFLANLSTGLLSEKLAGMFGSFLVTKIVNAAFRRAKLPESQRVPWYLYVDEFQNFMNVSVGFERILAEARKYKLILAGLANQYVGQLSNEVRAAIFGNIGTMVVFRLGVTDAGIVEKEMGVFTREEILSLELGEAIARAGGSSTAFNLQTYPPPAKSSGNPEERIVHNSRLQYARPRAQVEEEFVDHHDETVYDAELDDDETDDEIQGAEQADPETVQRTNSEETPSQRTRRRRKRKRRKPANPFRDDGPSDPSPDDLVM